MMRKLVLYFLFISMTSAFAVENKPETQNSDLSAKQLKIIKETTQEKLQK